MSDSFDFISHTIPQRPRRHGVDVQSLVDTHRASAQREILSRHAQLGEKAGPSIPDHSRRELHAYRSNGMMLRNG